MKTLYAALYTALLSVGLVLSACGGGSDGASGADVSSVADVGAAPDSFAQDTSAQDTGAQDTGAQDTGPDACQPQCAGRQCGDDGCGGTCGDCVGELVCDEATGQCGTVCTPACDGRDCGADGCGGVCGACDSSEVCTPEGQCALQGGEGSCLDWFECTFACETGTAPSSCLDACDAAVSTAGGGARDALIACQDENCAECSSTVCIGDCTTSTCQEPYDACVSGDGLTRCARLRACVATCPGQDGDLGLPILCRDRCRTLADAEAEAQSTALDDCLHTACPQALPEADRPACLAAAVASGGACVVPRALCVGEAPPEPFCDPEAETCLDCGGVLDCLGTCGVDAVACHAGCIHSASQATFDDTYTPLTDCLSTACPTGEAGCEEAAVAEGGACEALQRACVGGPGPAGSCVPADHPADYCYDCADVLACVDGCGADSDCAGACFERTTEESFGQFNALIACLYTECAPDDDACRATAMAGSCADVAAPCR